MKKTWHLFFLGVVLLLGASSCQKGYERPDVILGTNPGTGGGPVTGGTGDLLVKAEGSTPGTSEAYVKTYEYDSNKKLVKITTASTDSSGKTVTIVYRYQRDATGKVTRIISNIFSATQPGAGFPDSLYIDVHYPSGSSSFDYTKYTVPLGGVNYVDSITYSYAGGVIVIQSEFTGMVPGTGGMQLLETTTNTYVNGNLTTQKFFDQSSASVPYGTYAIEYDTKVPAIATGANEGFLPGQSVGYSTTNNPVKETFTDNRTGNVLGSATYLLQYNAANRPLSGSFVQTIPVNKTQAIKFTYQ